MSLTKFSVTENVSDNAVNFGRVSAPAASPGNTIVMYDYSGNHINNVNTFPDRSRLVGVEYDSINEVWGLGAMYASDVRITNRLLVQKGISKTVPLYFEFTSKEPLQSDVAVWDDTLKVTTNQAAMFNEYEIVDDSGAVINKREFLHDAEFIPYHAQMETTFNNSFAKLFFIRILSNGNPGDQVRKVRYKAVITSDASTPVEGGHTEYISSSQIMDLFNVSFEFKDGLGADLMGQSFEGSRRPPFLANPMSAGLFPSTVDPDNNRGRWDTEYSLIYNYAAERYTGIMTAKKSRLNKYNTKPCPALAVYYSGVKGLARNGVMWIAEDGSELVLHLKEPGVLGKTFRFFIKGKSTRRVAEEINSGRAPFTAYATLDVGVIGKDSFWIEIPTTFTQLYNNPYGSVSSQLFDLTSDGGLILRSSYYFSRYTQEPTIHCAPPPQTATSIQPWYPRIRFGGFVDDQGRAYFTNEYANQAWSLNFGYPWIDHLEQVYFEDRKTIQLGKFPIYNQLEHISLSDSEGKTLNDWIDGFDALNGRIYLKHEYKNTTRVLFVSYSYREKYYEVQTVNLNPVHPNEPAMLNTYYVVTIKPYISESNAITESVVEVKVMKDLPVGTHVGGNLILAAFRPTNQFSLARKDYSILSPKSTGGGLRKSIPSDELMQKVPDIQSFLDRGFWDGIRYPANSVIKFTLPNFIRQGTATIIMEPYKPTQLVSNEIKVYCATSILPGTRIRIYTGFVSSSSFEDSIVRGVVDHTTLRLETSLQNSYNTGSPVILNESRDGFFDEDQVKEILRKFAASGSYHFVEYK